MIYKDHANRRDHRSFSDDLFNTGESRPATGGEKSPLAPLYAKGSCEKFGISPSPYPLPPGERVNILK